MLELIDAARHGDLARAEALLEEEPAAHAQVDGRGMTALMWAACHGHLPLVHLLLARGAEPGAEDETGLTALVLAAERGQLGAVQALAPRAGPEERSEALRYASGAGHTHVVRWLLEEAGAPLEYGGADGKTALTCAVSAGHAALAEELLRRGADKEALSSTSLPFEDRDDYGWHPLHYAAHWGHLRLVELLLAAGAEVDSTTAEGTTPLMVAARRGHEDIARVLLAAGADARRRNTHGQMARALSRLPHLTALLEPPGDERPLATVLPFTRRTSGKR